MSDVLPLLTLALHSEQDIVHCRQAAKRLAAAMEWPVLEQIRLATAVSELARNIHQYAGSGHFDFALLRGEDLRLSGLEVRAVDQGPGIAEMEAIRAGSYRSSTGMGIGLRGAQRLFDDFDIQTSPAGTCITARKYQAPRPFPEAEQLQALTAELQGSPPPDPYQQIRLQSEELLLTNTELQVRQSELEVTNKELENTNQGVVALYSELEKATQELKEASEAKTRFFSNMTHEFRTPINIIENVAKLLASGVDGALNAEQQRQVRFISDAALELANLVGELLALAEVQSGRLTIVPQPFALGPFIDRLEQFAAALAPRYPQVSFSVAPPPAGVLLDTDESRLFQVLRNLISNAFKYTPRGQVRIQVFQPDDASLEFLVEDSGIGIAAADQQKIFEEFERIRSPHLTHIEGTGLGLPLAQRLAVLLRPAPAAPLRQPPGRRAGARSQRPHRAGDRGQRGRSLSGPAHPRTPQSGPAGGGQRPQQPRPAQCGAPGHHHPRPRPARHQRRGPARQHGLEHAPAGADQHRPAPRRGGPPAPAGLLPRHPVQARPRSRRAAAGRGLRPGAEPVR